MRLLIGLVAFGRVYGILWNDSSALWVEGGGQVDALPYKSHENYMAVARTHAHTKPVSSRGLSPRRNKP